MTLIGKKTYDLRNQCTEHPNAILVIGEGKGPHAYRFTCSKCNRFVGWVSKHRADILENAVQIS